MLNQLLIMGRVTEIYEDSFEIEISDSPTKDRVLISGASEEQIAMLLLNNVVSAKAHLVVDGNGNYIIELDDLIMLDRRGKKND